MIDREALAMFLGRRRKSLQPEDIGLRRGPRRRTEGLRREEVAALCNMSTELGETLRQTPMAIMLTGDASRRQGPARCLGNRWFTDPSVRAPHPPVEQAVLSRVYVSGMRALVTLRSNNSRARQLADRLLAQSEEFDTLWAQHEIGVRPPCRAATATPNSNCSPSSGRRRFRDLQPKGVDCRSLDKPALNPATNRCQHEVAPTATATEGLLS